MYYYISGELVMLSPTVAAIDCSGVAYKLLISETTYNTLAKSGEGSKVKLFSHLIVREEVLDLYGFATEEEMSAFAMLITCNGIGPKAAISILSVHTPQQFFSAVMRADHLSISRANGVGPKTAQRVILELKDRVSKIVTYPADSESECAVSSVPSQMKSDAVNALCVYGFTRSEASSAVMKAAKDGQSLEQLVADALKLLSKW